MKKKKQKILDSLIEGIFVLIFLIAFFGIGYLVCRAISLLFPVDISALDFDTGVVIGLIAISVIMVMFSRVKKLVKAKDKNAVCPSEEAACHDMKLHAEPFEKIKSGEKTIELRLFDEKRRKIKEGDIIIFTNNATGKVLVATVKKLHRFASFEELYQALPLLQCGYTAEDIVTAHPSDMDAYYSKEEQEKYGVVGIELIV